MEEPNFNNLGKLRMKTMPRHMPPKAKNQIILGLKSPYLKWNNVKWQLTCMTNMKKVLRLSKDLVDYTFGVNLLEEAKDYQVPVTFIHGDCDWVTPAVCTKQYMDQITAPHKEMVLMKDCSHSPHYDEPREFAEVLKGIETIEVLVSAIFEEKPERWGLRGDPYLWEDLKKEFSTVSVAISLEDFEKEFKVAFEKLTGTPLTRDCHLFLSQYANGGMSSGQISGEFWLEKALPLLVERLKSFK